MLRLEAELDPRALAQRRPVFDLRHPKFSLFAGVAYSRLLGDFKRSPIVAIAGDADQYLAALGLAYTF